MQISQPNLFSRPQQLIYKPLQGPLQQIFHKYSPAEIFSAKILKSTLEQKKITSLSDNEDALYCENISFSRCTYIIAALVPTLLCLPVMSVVYSPNRAFPTARFSDYPLQKVEKHRVSDYVSNRFIDPFTGRSSPDGLYVVEEPDAVSFILPLLMGIVCTTTVAALLINCFNKMQSNVRTAEYNARLDSLISTVSFTSRKGQDAALPEDVCRAFPYLPVEILDQLSFAQLAEVYKLRRPLFQQLLKDCRFSKQQSAIWRLFNHLVEANDSLRRNIYCAKEVRALIRKSDPLFFQTLVRELNSSSLIDIYKDILRQDILKKSVAHRLSEEDLEQIIKRTSQAEDLQEVLMSLLLPAAGASQDAYKAFMRTGKLTVYSTDELYTYYKKSLAEGNPELIAWFEWNLSRYLDIFMQPLQRTSLLGELSALSADGFKIKIDQHLAKQETLPAFDSPEFETEVHLSKKFALILYCAALKSHYSCRLQDYIFEGTGQEVALQVANFLAQFDSLFEDEKIALRHILAGRITVFLKSSPQSIDAISRAAKENAWLLNLISIIYHSHVPLFAKFCLFPLKEVLST